MRGEPNRLAPHSHPPEPGAVGGIRTPSARHLLYRQVRLSSVGATARNRTTSGWPDSNRRPLGSEPSALTKLRHNPFRVPSRTRTCDLDVRSVARFPTAPWEQQTAYPERDSNPQPSDPESDASAVGLPGRETCAASGGLEPPTSRFRAGCAASCTSSHHARRAAAGNRTPVSAMARRRTAVVLQPRGPGSADNEKSRPGLERGGRLGRSECCANRSTAAGRDLEEAVRPTRGAGRSDKRWWAAATWRFNSFQASVIRR